MRAGKRGTRVFNSSGAAGQRCYARRTCGFTPTPRVIAGRASGARGRGIKCPTALLPYCLHHNFTAFRRAALEMTLTEESDMAAAATMGESSQPVSG